MRCPYCFSLDNRVLDSRTVEDGNAIRRRRECDKCAKRFTTYERFEETVLVVVKKDGKREKFDRSKVLGGLLRACQKRPVALATIENIVSAIELHLRQKGEGEVSSDEIGNLVIDHLGRTDEVAYVRFASVYKEFKDVGSFADELKILQQLKENPP
jgi:transcriptional repressor NrdR